MPRHVLAIAAILIAPLVASAQSMDQSPPRVIQTDQLAKYWMMSSTTVDAEVPNYGRNMNQPGCATVSFVIEKNGSTSNVKVQRVVPDGDLGKVAKSVAASLRFEATALNAGKDRVFSWLIFPFNLPSDPTERTAVMQQCYVEKLDWKDH
ncbi:MAG: energy transducer TonB [Rhodanobacteraceae bacterium]